MSERGEEHQEESISQVEPESLSQRSEQVSVDSKKPRERQPLPDDISTLIPDLMERLELAQTKIQKQQQEMNQQFERQRDLAR